MISPRIAKDKRILGDKEQMLREIKMADGELHARFADKLQINYDLDRTLVSYQANKSENGHRWYKYKEGFSADLVRYVSDRFGLKSGRILDPFAGSGTALFTASDFGIDSVGIELLPNSAEIIQVRKMVRAADTKQLAKAIRKFRDSLVWQMPGQSKSFLHLRITEGAFPKQTETELGRYLYEAENVQDACLMRVLAFAALCVLEDVSYTRKDGQYLRWDYRSGRNVGKKPFCKGPIRSFTPAIWAKLEEIAGDICGDHLLFTEVWPIVKPGKIEILTGSCLDILPSLQANYFDGLITSPPYCNRYDYTRTYALELAAMGNNEDEIRSLRQAMLSCTVENREKEELGAKFEQTRFKQAITAFESQKLLGLVVNYLDQCRDEGLLNNPGIARMVRNYFKELAVVIFECARLLRPGARFVMVNDNVRYHGVSIPVDLVLSEVAQHAGFDVEVIWLLPRGKGNSSQQMGLHGREEMRKCVYVWSRQRETSQEARSESSSGTVRFAACVSNPD